MTTNSYMKHESWMIRYNDKAVNKMELVKHFCLNIDWDSIIDQAYDWCKENHYLGRQPTLMDELPKVKQTKYSSNKRMADLWSNTESSLRSQAILRRQPVKVGGGFIVRFSGNGSRAGPHYGCTLGTNWVSRNAGVDTIIHELAHIAHLGRYHQAEINGRARPHDIFYNRIMLTAMDAAFGLSKSCTDPIYMGYSIGNGYAPTKKVKGMINLDTDRMRPFITRGNFDWLDDREEAKRIKAAKPKKQRTTRQRGEGTYETCRGDIEITNVGGHGYTCYEIEAPKGFNWCGSHYKEVNTIKEAYSHLGTYDKDKGRYTGDELGRCEAGCDCEWDVVDSKNYSSVRSLDGLASLFVG